MQILADDLFDKYIDEEKSFSPHYGGILKTKKLGLADAYFFLSKKEFFDDYNVDWRYGDSNHGATMKCLEQGLKYLHLGPFYDNPNFDSMEQEVAFDRLNRMVLGMDGYELKIDELENCRLQLRA